MNGNFSESARTLTPNEFAANEIPSRGFSAPQHERSRIHQTTPTRYRTLKEYVQHTGLSESTIRRRVRDGSLPFLQLGGRNKMILLPADALTRVNTSMAFAGDDTPVEPHPLPPSGMQADDSAGSHPRWMQKLRRRAK